MLNPQQAGNPTAPNRKQRRAARRRMQGNGASGRASPARGSGQIPEQVKFLQKGVVHQKAGRTAQAIKCYRKAIAADPECSQAYFALGMIASRDGNNGGAYPLYKQAVSLDGQNASYWAALGNCLAKIGQQQAAVIAYENAISLKQDSPDMLANAGWAYYRDDKSAKALETFERALAIDPRCVSALLGKGQQCFSLGELKASREYFERALEIEPNCVEGHFRLIDLEKDPDKLQKQIDRIERILADCDDNWTAARLYFAMGKGYKRLKDHDKTFECFAAGNAAVRKDVGFDRDELRSKVDEIIEAFQPDTFESLADVGLDTRLPVFIVGMPRSGSTLLEQIISSHPDVEDAGEFPKLWVTACTLAAQQKGRLRYPRDIARIAHEPLQNLAEDYLDALCFGRTTTPMRITDKLLNNFFNVGLIHVLFPNATIFHTRRNPIDTAVSCFSQMFTAKENLAYANDLADLGFYYRQYERLMAHWREVLPGRVFEVQYEEMVDNQEEMSRAVIDHIGLEWNDACLEFYKLERSVRTASHSQVRKPVYKSSVEGWRKYEKYLGPLLEELEADD